MEFKLRANKKKTQVFPKNWVTIKVENIINHKKGLAFKSEWFASAGKRIVKVSDFTFDSIAPNACFFIGEEKAKDFKDVEIHSEDIIIATVGSWPNNPASIVGKVIKAPDFVEGALLNQNSVILRTKDGKQTNQLFLYYRLKASDFSEYIVSGAQGSANQASITLRNIFSFEFNLPPVSEQIQIGKILSDLDAKIEINNQMNKTLEGIGKAVFKRWFVDFEFPNEKGKPYKSSGGEMEKSQMGETPCGWAVQSSSEVIAINPLRKIENNTIAKKVEMADLTCWQPWISSWTTDNYKSGSRFQNGDTLFARITPCLENGKTALVTFLQNKEVAFGSTEFIVLSPKVIQSSYYVLLLATSKGVRDAATQSMTGSSGRQRVPNDFFDDFMVAVPPRELLCKFDGLMKLTFEKITGNMRESRTLEEIRDNLLPKIMSGKIRVPIERQEA